MSSSYSKYFLVPDYYPKFACKCGDCRSTCCQGWGIPISMEEYFNLIGRECSPLLRQRLDAAFHLADKRSPEHYAMVTPRFDGHCRLQADDGYCMLQRECGEDAIPTVCRYYPRAPRLSPFPECCTSASCEKTLELLFADTNPVEYVPMELTFRITEPPTTDFPADRYIAIRIEAFALLGDRSLSFSQRVERLTYRLFEMDGQTSLPDNSAPDADETLVLEFLSELERTSGTLRELMPNVREYYSRHSGTKSAEILAKAVDELDIKLEKLFVNHLFYKSFPNAFVSAENHLCEEAMALCMAIACTKLISAAYLDRPESCDTAFVDTIAQVFRVVEHSRFDECAVRFLRRKGFTSPGLIASLAEI